MMFRCTGGDGGKKRMLDKLRINGKYKKNINLPALTRGLHLKLKTKGAKRQDNALITLLHGAVQHGMHYVC